MFEYALLDSGDGRKLERFGELVLDRPEPKARWRPGLPQSSWWEAHAVFVENGEGGRWQKNGEFPDEWELSWESLRFGLRLTPFKHVGLFPEQAPQWRWLTETVRTASEDRSEPITVLNLFAYTGAATLACAAAGAAVTHIEASRSTLTWARQNAERSGLAAAPIRWIPEDALTFLRRLEQRGQAYDGIILDPPLTGVGPGGQRWQFGRQIDETLELCRRVLSPSPLFLLLNDYAERRPPEYWRQAFHQRTNGLAGTIESDVLTLQPQSDTPVIPTGTWARWSAV